MNITKAYVGETENVRLNRKRIWCWARTAVDPMAYETLLDIRQVREPPGDVFDWTCTEIRF